MKRYAMRIISAVRRAHARFHLDWQARRRSWQSRRTWTMTNEEFDAWQSGRIIHEWMQTEKIAEAKA